jgi:predicted dehydrogenase
VDSAFQPLLVHLATLHPSPHRVGDLRAASTMCPRTRARHGEGERHLPPGPWQFRSSATGGCSRTGWRREPSGDHLVEQAIHNVDLTNWAMNNEMPVKCVAHGGRQIRPENMVGHIFDHFSVVYEWANGVKGFVNCRQQLNCAVDNTEHVYGSNGTAHILLFSGDARPYTVDLKNQRTWKYDGDPRNPNMYVQEQKEFLQSIREGNPRNDGEWLAKSSMMGVMGRMAGYTGQEITWEEARLSNEKLVPDEFQWDKAPPVPPLAMPGQTKFI